MGVVFIAGVHAVGKSTSCRDVSKDYRIAHFSAGDLIKSERQSAASKGKAVADVEGNQQLLLKAVERKLRKIGHHMILDGHFTLINAKGSVVPINVEVFQKLPLSGIVVYYDAPEKIAVRMSERDDCVFQSDDIAHHQNLEIEHAERVSAELGVPMKLLRAFDADGLKHAIAQWLWNKP